MRSGRVLLSIPTLHRAELHPGLPGVGLLAPSPLAACWPYHDACKYHQGPMKVIDTHSGLLSLIEFFYLWKKKSFQMAKHGIEGAH